jgi:hypothetical protein
MAKGHKSVPNTPTPQPKTPPVERGEAVKQGVNDRLPTHPSPPPPPPPKIDDKG